LNADLGTCAQRYSYDPAKAANVAENALAPNELQWRQCIYEALGRYAKANPAMASTYQSLIANDMAMTSAIQQGTMTRSQRKARVEQLVAQIKASEDKMIAAAEVAHGSRPRSSRTRSVPSGRSDRQCDGASRPSAAGTRSGPPEPAFVSDPTCPAIHHASAAVVDLATPWRSDASPGPLRRRKFAPYAPSMRRSSRSAPHLLGDCFWRSRKNHFDAL
jgi:hypothetical protein